MAQSSKHNLCNGDDFGLRQPEESKFSAASGMMAFVAYIYIIIKYINIFLSDSSLYILSVS